MVERFAHPKGLLFFKPFWRLGSLEETVRLVEGELKGEGPWKPQAHHPWCAALASATAPGVALPPASMQSSIPSAKVGSAVVTVLGCQGTNLECAVEFDTWRDYLSAHREEVPTRQMVEQIAKARGAIVGR
jgi:hypothetical protein